MPTIAIMGAGPGMGLAIAQTFGKEGHQVALLSRTQAKLDPVVAELTDQGIEAAAFAADVLDRPAIVSGLAAVKQRFGQIDVLEYSPSNPALPSLLHRADPRQRADPAHFHVHGAVAAVNQMLPEMLARGSGTILFTTGASSVRPELGHDMFGNVAPAAAWLRNWAPTTRCMPPPLPEDTGRPHSDRRVAAASRAPPHRKRSRRCTGICTPTTTRPRLFFPASNPQSEYTPLSRVRLSAGTTRLLQEEVECRPYGIKVRSVAAVTRPADCRAD